MVEPRMAGNGVDYHELDKRVSGLEGWRNYTDRDLAMMHVAIKTEIPAHYSKRIQESEDRMELSIGKIISEHLDKRFGWMSRIWQGALQAVVIASILYLLGLA